VHAARNARPARNPTRCRRGAGAALRRFARTDRPIGDAASEGLREVEGERQHDAPVDDQPEGLEAIVGLALDPVDIDLPVLRCDML